MPRISIETNFPDVARRLEALRREVADKVTVRTLNAVTRLARTDMQREITREFAVQASFVRPMLAVKLASRRAGVVNLEAVLSAASKSRQRRGTNIIAFSARQTRKGVTVKVKRTGPRKLLRDAFIGNKGRTVFVRVPGTTMASRAKYRNKHGEKIKPVTTLDVAQMFNTRRLNAAVRRNIEQRFREVFDRELRFAVSQFERGGR